MRPSTFDYIRQGILKQPLTICGEDLLEQLQWDVIIYVFEQRAIRQLDPTLVDLQRVVEALKLIADAFTQVSELRQQKLEDGFEAIAKKIRQLQMPKSLISWNIYVQAQQQRNPALRIRICLSGRPSGSAPPRIRIVGGAT